MTIKRILGLMFMLAAVALVRSNQTAHAQSSSPPYFGIATEHFDVERLSAEFERAKSAGLTGLVVFYDSAALLEPAIEAANSANMQLLLYTDNPVTSPDYTIYATDEAFQTFKGPRLLTSLNRYRANSQQFDGIMWPGSTQLTEIPESLTAAKQVVDEMFALRRQLLRSGHLWTVVISADSPDLPTDVSGALAIAPDAIVVTNWESYSAELLTEIEKTRTTLADLNSEAIISATTPARPFQGIIALGLVAFALFLGGLLVMRKHLILTNARQ